ncbi:putative choline transporter, neither null mutation nor overexpression affects choline transport [Podila humilis]|nr:putative choline transporter, neither null mutation nor overexpression affects choline transport [Podila humilis]
MKPKRPASLPKAKATPILYRESLSTVPHGQQDNNDPAGSAPIDDTPPITVPLSNQKCPEDNHDAPESGTAAPIEDENMTLAAPIDDPSLALEPTIPARLEYLFPRHAVELVLALSFFVASAVIVLRLHLGNSVEKVANGALSIRMGALPYEMYVKAQYQHILVLVIIPFVILLALCWYRLRHRIAYTTVLLQSVSQWIQDRDSVILLSYGGMVILVIQSILFGTVTCLSAGQWEDRLEISSVYHPIAVTFSFLSFWWTSQVITHVIYATVATASRVHHLPTKVSQVTSVKSVLRHVCTTSLGTICYGSLFITPVLAARSVFHSLRPPNDDMDTETPPTFGPITVDCSRSKVNKYAFMDVAAFDKDYHIAARDTWTLIAKRQVAIMVQDSAMSFVIVILAIFYAGCAMSLALSLQYPEFPLVFNFAAIIMALQFVLTAGASMDAGVAGLLVALARDPLVFARRNPEVFEEIRKRYPKVLFGLVLIPGVAPVNPVDVV